MGNCYLVRRGGAGKRLPVLSAAYPADVTMWGEGGNAVFKVEIEKEGRPSGFGTERRSAARPEPPAPSPI